MRDTFPFFDFLVLPTDAGPGDPRIELDGLNGEIRVYDNNGDIIAIIDADHGVQVNEPGNTETGARVNLDVVGGLPFIKFFTGDADETLFGNIHTQLNTPTQAAMYIVAPDFAGETAGLVLFSDDGATPNGNAVVISGYDIQIPYPGDAAQPDPTTSLPRGIVDEFVATTDNGPHSGDTNTDFVLNNQRVVDGRTYEVWLKTGWDIDAAGIWSLDLHLNGSKIDEFDQIQVTTGLNGKFTGCCLWTPTATAATDDLLVVANEQSGASNLTLTGAADQPRRMYLKDIGIL